MSRGDPQTFDGASMDDRIRENRVWLEQAGSLVIRSGCFDSEHCFGSLDCDFGPPDQDKTENQDFALAWVASKNDPRSIRLAVAIADGLTDSRMSEKGAALACWAGLRNLVERLSSGSATDVSTGELAKPALDAAGAAIGRLADDMAFDPQASCPTGEYASTWRYILRTERLLQTTLTLFWLTEDAARLAIFGDSGASWRDYGSAECSTDRVLAACDLSTQQVQAIGPGRREIAVNELDHCDRIPIRAGSPFMCAIHTDGLGRIMGINGLSVLHELDSRRASSGSNEAQNLLAYWKQCCPKGHEDNLSLLVIRGKNTTQT